MAGKRTRAVVSTPAAMTFRQNFGKRNHNLVTAVAALELLLLEAPEYVDVQRGVVDLNTRLPKYLHGSWHPRVSDHVHSIRSTMDFVLGASLNFLIDGVDGYFKGLAHRPSPLPQDVLDAFHGDDTVYQRFNRIVGYIEAHSTVQEEMASDAELRQRFSVDAALFQFARELRNDVTHSLDGEQLSNPEKTLGPHYAWISDTYRHFDPRETYQRVRKRQGLTLKDVASLYASGVRFVEQLDYFVLKAFGVHQYCSTILTWHFTEQAKTEQGLTRQPTEAESQRVIRGFLNSPLDKVQKKIRLVLAQRVGFPKDWSLEETERTALGREALNYLASLRATSKEVIEEHFLKATPLSQGNQGL